ncbi:histidine phosphatase family protein [Streptomyces sp. Lzd4kr]|nr:histidine phosphatase family protein [Streptomyces sp. Lzd4kr]
MGELLLIRHGETAWSRSGQHTSFTDLPLTALGEEQARAAASLLAGRNVVQTLVSPLQRATRTAELVGLTDVRIEPDLHEWSYGAYEGITTADIHVLDPAWNLWTDGAPTGQGGQPGESPDEVAARVDRVLTRVAPLLRGPDAGDVALVAHGHVLRVLTARWLGLPPGAGALFALSTATVSRLGTEHDRPVLTGWNTEAPALTAARRHHTHRVTGVRGDLGS